MENAMRTAQPRAGVRSVPNDAKLEVTAQILSFEPGVYSVDVQASQIMRGASGMMVPCVRLDPINNGDSARSFVSALSDTQLIYPGDHASYLRVLGSKASVLLTIYKMAGGMAPPELRISLVQPSGSAPPDHKAAEALASEPLKLMAHVERAGDVAVKGGLWAGQPGGRGAIEGFSVTPGDTIKPDDIEYQAVLGSDWTTPWLSGGEFCGSRGLSLPLLGARIRLRGEAAKLYSVSYWGSFVGTGEIGPVADGAVCGGSGAPLEALRVVLTRRASQPTATLINRPAAAAVGKPGPPIQAAASVPPAKPQAKSAKAGNVTPMTAIRSKLGRK
jgi:hypothetical protein